MEIALEKRPKVQETHEMKHLEATLDSSWNLETGFTKLKLKS